MKNQEIKKTHLIEKRNILNEMRINTMTLQELRFLSIYLSKINARHLNTRIVKFELTKFRKIMDIERLRIDHTQAVTNSLLQKVVNISDGNGGYIGFQLFKECRVFKDENGVWYIEIDAHDKALPLMFDFKANYFYYQLGNVLQLKSINQLRMYEILKQYEKIGEKTIALEELRLMLGIQEEEYPAFAKFRIRVLEACKLALSENTDIKYEYELLKKGVGRGTGRKITHIKFIIKKNKNYKDSLNLEEFIDLQPEQEIIDIKDYPEVVEEFEEKKEYEYENETIAYLADSCDNEFNNEEVKVLLLLVGELPIGSYGTKTDMYRFLRRCYSKMNVYAERNKIHNRFAYIQKIIKREERDVID
jgi:plasmid replication initiation protein